MRCSPFRPIAALAGAILLGCGKAASPSAPADAPAPSFRAEHFIVANACAFAGAPLVGTGTGKFTFNVQDSGPGALVIHATVQGIVDLVAGGQARVFATARVTVLPDATLLFDDEVVRLTPL